MSLIQVINPNTSLAMTETIAQAARAVAAPGTDILAVSPSQGVPSIEGHFDEAIAAIGVLEQVRLGREQGLSGHVIACFGDPGLLAARELASGPVIGIAEAAMHTATLLATRFSIVTTLPRTLVIARHLLQQYGFTHHCAALHAIDLPVLALEDGSGLAQEKVREQAEQQDAEIKRSEAMVRVSDQITKVAALRIQAAQPPASTTACSARANAARLRRIT